MTETPNELMRATYTALCKRGYASLRMQDIADESSKSKATLHYHYESKRELLSAFLDYLYDGFAERLDDLDGERPVDRLLALVDVVLTPRDEDTHRGFQTALLEIKAQGPYDDQFREQLLRFDRLLHDRFESLLEAGQRDGDVRAEVDPDETADFFVTAVNGAQTRYVSVGHPVERARDSLTDYVTRQLLTDAATDRVVSE
ncbi:TetR/AcrR family transcriptional regulator [Halorussus amylolyticus]|uniref:TetR/AcrR family transcriptional regulator n=1 Tax=Halorussus amylolyticus TaxID=1126242 RepID=UPI001EE4D719|nr:TetR/AcrR family transcriptional regulator [Halorussus amylolyticus]